MAPTRPIWCLCTTQLLLRNDERQFEVVWLSGVLLLLLSVPQQPRVPGSALDRSGGLLADAPVGDFQVIFGPQTPWQRPGHVIF